MTLQIFQKWIASATHSAFSECIAIYRLSQSGLNVENTQVTESDFNMEKAI